MKVGVIGASGYTGLELLRIVHRHPRLELAAATSEQKAGQPVGDAYPSLRGVVDATFESLDPAALAGRIDVAFLCLPHATAAPVAAVLHKAGVLVVDISADFRLTDPDTYEAWYGPHGAPELFGQGVYGLPELYRKELVGASLIATAGCYPTAALVPMLPLLREGVVEPGPVVVDAKSGVSGAGRSLADPYLFAELDGNVQAYKVANHRHQPEMEQEASIAAGEPVSVTFVPQLLPLVRGIACSVYLRAKEGLTTEGARDVLARAYADAPFVRVLATGETPALAHVRGSNFCDVAVTVDDRNGTVVALSAIDNLVKGAVGQGVQCLNLSLGWRETEGLEEAPLRP
jgi:N-acetyl-gamma-glutamyl-phosphate reductase